MTPLVTPSESAVLLSLMYNVYGGPDVCIPKWAHNESRKPHRFTGRKAAGVIRSLVRKGYVERDDECIWLSNSGVAAATKVALQEYSPDMRDLAKRVFETVYDKIEEPDAWIRAYGRDAAKRSVDEFIDGDIYYFPELLFIVEAQIEAWMHTTSEATAAAQASIDELIYIP